MEKKNHICRSIGSGSHNAMLEIEWLKTVLKNFLFLKKLLIFFIMKIGQKKIQWRADQIAGLPVFEAN